MTATAIIDEIKALPPGEQAKIIGFVDELKSTNPIRYASKDDVARVIDEVFTDHAELMRKLSQ